MISAVYAAVGGALLGHAHGQRGPDARLLDALGQHRLHGPARRLRVLLRPAPGRLRLHLPPGHRDVRLPLLAAHLRRHPRLHRHLRARRPHGPLRAAAGPSRSRASDDPRGARRPQALRRLRGARRREPRHRRGRVRLHHRAERRRQVHADQRADGRARADRGQRALQGRGHRRHRAGRPHAARHGAELPARPDLPAS